MSSLGNKEIFAENLNYYMDRDGISQKELSEVTGVATSTVNDWAKAKKYPRIDKIELLANYFRILKSDLIEKKVKDEDKKANNALVGVTAKLRKDKELFELVEQICNLSPAERTAIFALLTTFKK